MRRVARARLSCETPRRQGCGESTTSNEWRRPRRASIAGSESTRAPRYATRRIRRARNRARDCAGRKPGGAMGAVRNASRARFPCSPSSVKTWAARASTPPVGRQIAAKRWRRVLPASGMWLERYVGNRTGSDTQSQRHRLDMVLKRVERDRRKGISTDDSIARLAAETEEIGEFSARVRESWRAGVVGSFFRRQSRREAFIDLWPEFPHSQH